MIKISIPLNWNLSKNRARKISTKNGQIRSYKTDEHIKCQDEVEFLVKAEINRVNWRPERKKLWLMVKVFKKDHNGDSSNMLNPIEDAVKKAIQLDDCWNSTITDWELCDVTDQRVEIYISQVFSDILTILKYV